MRQAVSYLVTFSKSPTVAFFAVAVLLPQFLSAMENVQIHGYVTAVHSYRTFEVEDYRIERAEHLPIELSIRGRDSAGELKPEDLRVGMEVVVNGEATGRNKEIHASSIRVFQDDLEAIRRSVLIELPLSLRVTEFGWEGEIFADGQIIRFNPFTVIKFEPNRSEKRAQGRDQVKKSKATAGLENASSQPFGSIDQVGPNTFLTYEGLREADGSIAATRLTFVRNELQPNEARWRKRLESTVKEPGTKKNRPKVLTIGSIGRFRLVPSDEAQSYLGELGESLIPKFQRELPPNDPNKIPFRFYLVQGRFPNAFALPNGIIVVNTSMVGILENEAQLAFVLSHEISHAVQEHTRQRREHKKFERTALLVGSLAASVMGADITSDVLSYVEQAIEAGHSRKHENQADRVGLANLVLRGYDPREASRVWKILSEKNLHSPAFFWASHDNPTKRRSFLMAEIRNNYANLDFSSYRRDSDAYQEFVQQVRETRRKKRR